MRERERERERVIERRGESHFVTEKKRQRELLFQPHQKR